MADELSEKWIREMEDAAKAFAGLTVESGYLLALLSAARREKKLLGMLAIIDDKIGHFAVAPTHEEMPMLSIIGDTARMVKEALKD